MGRSLELTASWFGAFLVVCHLLLWSLPFSQGLPLSTRSQWIVDDSTGGRVKLACVNWVAHLTPMLAEGLDKRPLRCIVHTIASWGFNCVRLTWATSMFTDASLANETVSQTFAKLSLKVALAGIAKHNPEFLHLSTVEAFKAVAGELGRQGVMVVLDNQMSRPGWCCGENDGNGFWGDREFDPGQWLQGLIEVASTFRNCPYVVAMSLRNELRGSRQNVPDWYKYMQMGAEAIHEANPNLLVIHGGLSYAQNLRFLASKPLDESLQSKIVYEVHRYSFTNGDSYTKGNLNDKCASVISQMRSASGFVTEPNRSFTGPLFVSEFGVEQTGARPGDARFIACLFAFLAEGDLDWALWAFQGSYYLRQGKPDLDETFGLLNHAWQAPRNASLLRKLQSLQPPLVQDPDLAFTDPSRLIFHPATGLCINRVSTNTLFLDSCTSFEFSTWTFTAADGMITLDGTRMAIAAQGDGLPALLAVEPSGDEQLGSNSIVRPASWSNSLSSSRMQFSTQLPDGEAVCLDGTSPPSIFTRPCICLHNTSCSGLDDPSGQWFELVTTSRLSTSSSL